MTFSTSVYLFVIFFIIILFYTCLFRDKHRRPTQQLAQKNLSDRVTMTDITIVHRLLADEANPLIAWEGPGSQARANTILWSGGTKYVSIYSLAAMLS